MKSQGIKEYTKIKSANTRKETNIPRKSEKINKTEKLK